MPMEIKTTPYDRGERLVLHFGPDEEVMTKQADTDAADINKIMAKYGHIHNVPHGQTQAAFGDFTTGRDLHQAIIQIDQAYDAFNEYPSAIRERFGNDPAQMIAFIADPENRQEAIELGFIDKPVPEPVQAILVPNEPKPEEDSSSDSD